MLQPVGNTLSNVGKTIASTLPPVQAYNAVRSPQVQNFGKGLYSSVSNTMQPLVQGLVSLDPVARRNRQLADEQLLKARQMSTSGLARNPTEGLRRLVQQQNAIQPYQSQYSSTLPTNRQVIGSGVKTAGLMLSGGLGAGGLAGTLGFTAPFAAMESKKSGQPFSQVLGRQFGDVLPYAGIASKLTTPFISKFAPSSVLASRLGQGAVNALESAGLDLATGNKVGAGNTALAFGMGVAGRPFQGNANAKGFSLGRTQKEEIAQIEDRLLNPSKYMTPKNKLDIMKSQGLASLKDSDYKKMVVEQAKMEIDQLAGRYLPNEVLNKVAGDSKKIIKALIDLGEQNKLGNFKVGLVGDKNNVANAGLYDTITQDGIKKVQGKPVKIVEGIDTFIHQGDNPKRIIKGFVVSEKSTGRYIGSGETERLAIQDAKNNISTQGLDKLKQALEKYKLQPNFSQQPTTNITKEGLYDASKTQDLLSRYGDAKHEFITKVNEVGRKYKTDAEIPTNTKKQLQLLQDNMDKTFEEYKLSVPQSTITKGVESMPQGFTNNISENQDRILSKVRPNLPQTIESVAPKTNGQALVETIAEQAQKGTAKVRKFVTTVKDSVKTAPELKNMVEGFYIPKSNDSLSNSARRQIANNIDVAREKALNGLDDEAVAIANELIQHYSKLKDFDTAAYIANTAAENLTAHGRAVQAASLYDKLSPEGIQRFAATQLQKVKQILKPEDSKRLFDMATEIQKLPAGTEKAMAQQKLMEEVQGLIPTPVYQKIITLWKAGLLTGLKTTGRNLTSNAVSAVSETVKDIPAATTDMIASLFTGKRAKTFNLEGAGSGFYEGVQKGMKTFLSGFDERKQMGKLDVNFVNWGKSPLGKVAKIYTDTIFKFLGAQDQPFYYSALKRSLYDQAKAEAINMGKRGDLKVIEDLVQNPTGEMIKNSVLDAETAVFQQNTALGEAISKAKNALKGKSEFLKAGADFIAPFTGVPSGILSQVINYSPTGIAKTIIENIGKGRFDQRAFSQGIGRGLTGTAIIAIGYELAKKGLMNLDFPTSEKERQQWDLEGRKPFSVLVDGKWRQIGSIGPQASALLSGGYLTKGITQYALGTLKQQKEQTFLQGVSNITSAIDNPKGYAQGFIQSTAGSIVPTIVGDVAKGTDPLQREINSPIEAIKAKIPGQRTDLLPKKNAFGENMQNEQGFIGSMLDIFNSSSAKDSAVINELRRLMDAGFASTPTKIDKGQTIGGQKIEFTPEMQDAFEGTSGPVIKQIWQEMITSKDYQSLSDDNKAKVLQNLIESVRKVEKLKIGVDVAPDAVAKGLSDLTKNERTYLTSGVLPIKMPKEKQAETLNQSQVEMAKDILTSGGDVSTKLARFVASTKKPKKIKIPKIKVGKIKIKKIKVKAIKSKMKRSKKIAKIKIKIPKIK